MPGHVTLVYNNPVAGVADANVDMTAAADVDFTQDGSGHYRFTEDYQLFAAGMFGASVLRGRFQVPHWNAIDEFEIFAANRSLGPPANPWLDWWMDNPIPIPKFESFKVQDSNNLGASTEIENAVLMLKAADGFWPVPSSGIPYKSRATFTVTPTLNAWSGGQALAFTGSQRGGVYSVIGATLQGANAVAFRLIFPKYRMYNGRKLRPGGIVQAAAGNALNMASQLKPGLLGEWGRFWTQEPLTCEVFGTVAGSIAYVLYLDLIYLGDDPSLVTQGAGGGSAAYQGASSIGM